MNMVYTKLPVDRAEAGGFFEKLDATGVLWASGDTPSTYYEWQRGSGSDAIGLTYRLPRLFVVVTAVAELMDGCREVSNEKFIALAARRIQEVAV